MKRISSILFALVLVVSLALVTPTPVLAQPLCWLGISSTAGGSVTTPGEGAFWYDAGTVVNLVAIPASGYQFDCWTTMAGSFGNPNAAVTTFTMPAQNTTITAHFEVVTYYYLITLSTTGGSVTTPGEGNSTYAEGTVVNLVATPDAGYQFLNWTGNVGTIANVNAPSTTITINGDYSITANFEEIPVTYYTLTMAVNGGGSTSPSVGQHTCVAGTVIPISATPASGYSFINWTGDAGTIANVNDPTTTIIMNGHYSITGNFEEIPVTYYTLTMALNGSGSTSPSVGQHTYVAGTVVPISATPASGYRFVNWTGDVGTIANVNAATTTITMDANYSITANFEVIPPVQYSLSISSTTGGSVTTPGQGTFTYDEGTVVDLVATPATGYRFVNWSGDVGTIADVNAATTTITMQSDYGISARFLPDAIAAKTETVTDDTVDATEEADTEVEVVGTATVTVAPYEENPGGPPPTGFSSLNKYIDVYVPDTTEVTGIQIRLYYTDAEVAAANVSEESLRLFWWDGHDWVACSDSGLNTDSTNGYSGYMWAKIRSDTTPTLDQLQGTEWGGYGHPSEPPQPLCSIATAAYSTDTAEEIDILREFRDAVLLPNSLGAGFVSLYYKTSPLIANFISQHEVLRTAVRVGFVDPIVAILNWSHDLWSEKGP